LNFDQFFYYYFYFRANRATLFAPQALYRVWAIFTPTGFLRHKKSMHVAEGPELHHGWLHGIFA